MGAVSEAPKRYEKSRVTIGDLASDRSTRGVSRALLALLSFVLGACTPPPVEPGGHVEFKDETGLEFSLSWAPRDTGDSLRWVGQISNSTPSPIRIEFGACALAIQAFDLGGTTTVWVSGSRAPYQSDTMYFCPLYLAGEELLPGQTQTPYEFSLGLPVLELLGDSLPDGSYRFEAWFELKNRRVGPLRLGTAVLER